MKTEAIADLGSRRAHVSARRFILEQTSWMEWVLIDTTIPRADFARVIASVYEYEPSEYGVEWFDDVELRVAYNSLDDLLEDVHRNAGLRRADRGDASVMTSGPHRPVTIAHHAPPAG